MNGRSSGQAVQERPVAWEVCPFWSFEGRPVVLADGVRLHEHVVPVGLRVAGHREVHGGAVGGHVDHVRQALVRRRRLLRDRQVGAGRRLGPVDQVGVDRVVDLQPARGRVVRDVELPDIDGGEVAGHRVVGAPVPRRVVAGRLGADEPAVRDDREAGRHGDVERVRRRVVGMVVDREPLRGRVRLARDREPVIGRDEAAVDPADRTRRAAVRDAAVGDLDHEPRAVGDASPRGDPQLLARSARTSQAHR